MFQIKARKGKERLHVTRAQLNSVSMQLQTNYGARWPMVSRAPSAPFPAPLFLVDSPPSPLFPLLSLGSHDARDGRAQKEYGDHACYGAVNECARDPGNDAPNGRGDGTGACACLCVGFHSESVIHTAASIGYCVSLVLQAGIIDEMMEETMEMTEDDDVEEEADEEVDKVLYEITDGKLGSLEPTPTHSVPSAARSPAPAAAVAAGGGGAAAVAADATGNDRDMEELAQRLAQLE